MPRDLTPARRGFNPAGLSPEGHRNHTAGRALVARHYAQQSARELAAATEALAMRRVAASLLPYAELWGSVESGRPGYAQYAAAIREAREVLGLPARGAA